MNPPILLVEDNPSDIKLTIRAFQQSKLSNPIQVVMDGAAALDYLFKQDGNDYLNPLPILVLLDIQLPKVDGLEVLEQIRLVERTAMLPVVILTSSSEHEDILRSYQLRVNNYIRKPIDFKEFLVTVQRLGLYWLVLKESPYAV